MAFAPRSVPRRGLARATIALAAAGAACAILSATFSRRAEGSWVPASAAQQQSDHLVFCLGSGCSQARTSSIARSAGSEDIPGGAPKADGEALGLQPAVQDGDKRRAGVEPMDKQFGRVAYQDKLYKRLKGKYMPIGPKPWDQHRFTKVSIQVRLKSKQAANTKILNQIVEELRRMTGVHPRIVKAKHNVANYGWRIGYPCGVAVTLEGPRMYDFLHRLNMVILPRVRDFEGLYPSSFDNHGNFWMGFTNQEPFKELDAMIDERVLVHGFDVGLINNVLTQPDGLALMKNFGFPFGDPREPNVIKKKVAFQKMRNEPAKR